MPEMFDDLIPQQQAAPSGSGGLFDDLIPKTAPATTANPQSAYEKYKAESEASGGPDVMSRAITGATNTIGKGIGEIADPNARIAGVLPRAPVDIAKGVMGLATAPIGVAQDAAAKGISGITGGIVTPEEASTALMAMRPFGSSPKGMISTPAPKPPPPTTEELFNASQGNYAAARGLGVEIKPASVSRLADDITSELQHEGYDKELVPHTFRAIEKLRNPVGENVTISDIDSARKLLNRAGALPVERDSTRRAISAIDDYMANLDPADAAVNEHFVPKLQAQMAEARGNYAAAKRSETLETTEEAATDRAATSGSGANINNVMRQDILKILKNPKQRRGFSDDEIAQMRKIVRSTFVGNAARLIGKLYPAGVVSGGISGLAAHAVLGPAGVPATWALGYGAKKLGDISTARNIAKLGSMVRSRSPLGSVPAASVPPPAPKLYAHPHFGVGASPFSPPDETP